MLIEIDKNIHERNKFQEDNIRPICIEKQMLL